MVLDAERVEQQRVRAAFATLIDAMPDRDRRDAATRTCLSKVIGKFVGSTDIEEIIPLQAVFEAAIAVAIEHPEWVNAYGQILRRSLDDEFPGMIERTAALFVIVPVRSEDDA